MHKYIIERTIPGCAAMTAEAWAETAARSNAVVRDLQPRLHWVHSYVTDGRLYCVYIAESAEVIAEHARCGGFPADRISRVARSIDPTTAADGAPAAG